MTIYQNQLKACNLETIKQTLRRDELIACTNATVIVDGSGNVTGWFNNDVPVAVLAEG